MKLISAIVIGAMAAATCFAAEPAPSGKRPLNVLWIVADDHAAYALGGNPQVRTPNLDRLAAEGIRFERAYCNSPVCTASRQSFLTGRYPRTLGVTQLATPLPDSTKTLAHYFKAAGYDTASIGKMHFNSALKHGFDLRIDLPEFNAALQAKGTKPVPNDMAVQPPWRPFKDHARVWLNSAALPYGACDEDMPDTWLAGKTANDLTAERERPFFLMVSFYEPHSPFRFPVEYRGRIDPAKMPVIKPGPEDDAQIPAIFRDLTDREKRGIAAAYYTSVEHLDKNVGLVLDALKKSGHEKDTVVVYTGDHGYLLGQHGRFEKHCMFEEAVRAPLLVRYPEVVKPGGTSSALIEFIDIAPTLLESCGLPVPAEVQGRSFLPLLRGKTTKHREHVVAEYSENEEAMVRIERWKLAYGTGKRERKDGYATGRPLPGRTVKLIDLESDPGELKNLAAEPEQAERVRQLTALLADHMRRTARRPELLPRTNDPSELIDAALKPDDVGAKE
jgi:arylsulfatase A-like enzyme